MDFDPSVGATSLTSFSGATHAYSVRSGCPSNVRINLKVPALSRYTVGRERRGPSQTLC